MPAVVDVLVDLRLRGRSDDPEVYYYLGMTHFQLKQPSESKVALQRALDSKVEEKLAAEAKRILAQLK